MIKSIEPLRKHALALPDAVEGVACEGTPAERRTVRTNEKAFVFLGTADVMLKLADSLDEARPLAAKEPDRYRPGSGGWTKISFDASSPPDVPRLKRWIEESHRLMAES